MIKKFKDYMDSFKVGGDGAGFTPDAPTKPVTPETPGTPAAVVPDGSSLQSMLETPASNEVKKDKKEKTENAESPVETKSAKDTHNGKDVSGFKEVIEIVGIGKMKAKLDTGNTTKYCAIIVQDFKEKDGKVTFKFDDEDQTYDVVKHIKVWHHGKSSERPVIKVDLKFNGKEYKDELVDLKISDLTGTKNYRSRMLICKDFMERANIVIDPSKDFKLTDKKELPKKKKTKK